MIIDRNYDYEERLYSTGYDYLDELMERAFCDGYEYAQREFGALDNFKGKIKNLQRGNKDSRVSTSNINTRINARGINSNPFSDHQINRDDKHYNNPAAFRERNNELKQNILKGRKLEADLKSKNPLKQIRGQVGLRKSSNVSTQVPGVANIGGIIANPNRSSVRQGNERR